MSYSIKSIMFLELYSSFSEVEKSRFDRFVDSGYFNTDRFVKRLLSVVKKQAKGKTRLDTEEQWKFFNLVFKEKKCGLEGFGVREKSLLNAKMAILQKLAKQFLCFESFYEKPACESELLYKKLLQKKQYGIMQRKINADRELLERVTVRGEDFYRFAIETEKGQLQYFHHNNLLFKEDNIDVIGQHLDLYYLINKLNLALTAAILEGAVPDRSFDSRTQEVVNLLCDLPEYAEHPSVKTLRQCIVLTREKTLENYLLLVGLLDEFQDKIPRSNLMDAYLIAGNFCVWKILNGELDFNAHLFGLYKTMDEKGLILEDGFLQINKLKNIITVALKMNAFEWAKGFIEKYRNSIQQDFRESACHFNYGAIAFYQKDFKTAIHHFIRVDNVDLNYKVNCRMLLLKAYFHLDENYDERTMTTFRTETQFIRKQKALSANYRKSFNNFTTILTALYRFRHRATKKSLESIQQKLDGLDVVSDRKWLMEQVAELRKMKRFS